MNRESQKEPGMTTSSIYQIIVKGMLSEHWTDWFNGTLIHFENNVEGKPHTELTCKVRDQSELLGILNRLSSLNLPLLPVIFISKG